MGDDDYDLSKYYRCQTDICFSSQLYGDRIVEHGSKVLMLFAEVYSFLVKGFSVETASFMIANYSNSDSFKLWFWKIKHALGIELQHDPNYNDIGKWVGKGFLLKIVLKFNVVSDRLSLRASAMNSTPLSPMLLYAILFKLNIINYIFI